MTEIRIVIGTDGKVNIDVAGVKGKSCTDLTKSIEKALGRVQTTKKKSEFFQQAAAVSGNQTLGH